MSRWDNSHVEWNQQGAPGQPRQPQWDQGHLHLQAHPPPPLAGPSHTQGHGHATSSAHHHPHDEPYFPSPQWPAYHHPPPPQAPDAYLAYGQPWVLPPQQPAFNPAFFNPSAGPFASHAPYGAPFHPTPPAHAPAPFAPSAPWNGYGRSDDRGERDWRGGRGGRDGPPSRRDVERRPYTLYDRRDGPSAPPPRRSWSPTRGRGNSRSRSPEPYPSAAPAPAPPPPAYAADGTYIPPARRVRQDVRTAPVIPPTAAYLAVAEQPSRTVPDEQGPDEPLYLVMDLNHTLLVRSKRDRTSSRMPVARPYLSTFLSFICARGPSIDAAALKESSATASTTATTTTTTTTATQPRFEPIVYSSARAPNVLSMLAALSLVPPARAASYVASLQRPGALPTRPPPYEPRAEDGDVLRMVFTRSMMGLPDRDYRGDVETVKDLGKVWELLEFGQDAVRSEGEAREVRRKEAEKNAERAAAKRGEAGGATAGDADELPQEDGPVEAVEEVGEKEDGPAAERGHDGAPPQADKPLRLNKKAKARIAQACDERGAKRTLLLDDEAGKAAQQPHSHLPIPPFLVHPSHFPTPPASAYATDDPALATALSLDPAHPPAQDRALLIAIAQLESARKQTNVAAWVRAGGLDELRDEARERIRDAGTQTAEGQVGEEEVDEELAKWGEEVCARYGVEVRREWDPEWRVKLLEKEGRLSSAAMPEAATAGDGDA